MTFEAVDHSVAEILNRLHRSSVIQNNEVLKTSGVYAELVNFAEEINTAAALEGVRSKELPSVNDVELAVQLISGKTGLAFKKETEGANRGALDIEFGSVRFGEIQLGDEKKHYLKSMGVMHVIEPTHALSDSLDFLMKNMNQSLSQNQAAVALVLAIEDPSTVPLWAKEMATEISKAVKSHALSDAGLDNFVVVSTNSELSMAEKIALRRAAENPLTLIQTTVKKVNPLGG